MSKKPRRDVGKSILKVAFDNKDYIEAGDFVVFKFPHEGWEDAAVSYHGHIIPDLTPREKQLIALLISQPDETLKLSTLSRLYRNAAYPKTENGLTMYESHIVEIRKKIRAVGKGLPEPAFILNDAAHKSHPGLRGFYLRTKKEAPPSSH